MMSMKGKGQPQTDRNIVAPGQDDIDRNILAQGQNDTDRNIVALGQEGTDRQMVVEEVEMSNWDFPASKAASKQDPFVDERRSGKENG